MKSTLKAILKVLLVVFLVLYLGIEIFVTLCLLNLNDEGVTQFGDDTTLVIMNDSLSDNYKKGDLLVVHKGNGEEVSTGDFIFFYNPSEDYVVNFAEVASTYDTDGYYTFVVGNDYNVYYDYYIGKDCDVYRGIGSVLSVLESQWGFLLLIILPTLIAIIFEIYAILLEVIELKKEA